MSPTKLMLACAASALIAVPASSAVVSIATFLGADTGVRDTITGDEWIDPFLVAGNVSDINARLADPGDPLFGWRRATTIEVAGLWDSADIAPTSTDGTFTEGSDPAQVAAISALMDLLQIGPEGGGSLDVTIGYTAEPGSLATTQTVAWLTRRYDRDLDQFTLGGAILGDERSATLSFGDNIGSWLIRSAQVPEPAALALFGLGALALTLRRRG